MNSDQEHDQPTTSGHIDPPRVLISAVYKETISILGLSLGRVTAIFAVLLTIGSAIQLSAVSYGNTTTAIAILHEEKGTLLPLQVLVSSMSAIAAGFTSAAIAALTLPRAAFLARLISAVMVLVAVSPLMLIRDYVWPLLTWLGMLTIRHYVRKGAQAKAERRASGQRELLLQESADSVVAMMQKYKTAIRVVAISLGLLIFALTFETRPWIPAHRIVLQNEQSFTGFILSNNDMGYTILRDDPRLIFNYGADEIARIELCAWQIEWGPDFLPRVIRRDALLTPTAFISFHTSGRNQNYVTCPR